MWDGFSIDETNAPPNPDTGPVTVVGATGVTLRNLTLRGTQVSWDDNHNGIRIEGSTGTLVQNNLVYGFGSASGYGQNDAAVMLYDSNDTVIEHNELHSSGAGVFVKGQHTGQTQRRNVVRYNLIYNMGSQGLTIGPAARDGRTYQNVIRDCGTNSPGIRIYDFGTGEGTEPINEIIANNTIDGCAYGVQFLGTGQNVRVWNNLVTNSGRAAVWSWGDNNPGTLSFEHNDYFTFASFAELSSGNLTFATWKSSFGKDQAAPASVNVNPNYANRAGKDFRIGSSSPVFALGVDLLDLNGNGQTTDPVPAGAYVSGSEVIGRGAGGGGNTVPTAPNNLRIIVP